MARRFEKRSAAPAPPDSHQGLRIVPRSRRFDYGLVTAKPFISTGLCPQNWLVPTADPGQMLYARIVADRH